MSKHPDTTEWDRMRREQRSRQQAQALTGRHVIADIFYALERIECTCGVVVRAEKDVLVHDRHAPLVAAWEAHKREARAAAA